MTPAPVASGRQYALGCHRLPPPTYPAPERTTPALPLLGHCRLHCRLVALERRREVRTDLGLSTGKQLAVEPNQRQCAMRRRTRDGRVRDPRLLLGGVLARLVLVARIGGLGSERCVDELPRDGALLAMAPVVSLRGRGGDDLRVNVWRERVALQVEQRQEGVEPCVGAGPLGTGWPALGRADCGEGDDEAEFFWEWWW